MKNKNRLPKVFRRAGKKELAGVLTAVLALVLVLCTIPVKSSLAYFTDYTKVAGSIPVTFRDHDEHHEDVVGFKKEISITNTSAYFSYVRVKVFAPQGVGLTIYGNGWSEGAEGFWYYASALNPGETTNVLTIEIEPNGRTESFNVVVTDENTPALFTSEGVPYADWSQGGAY